MRTRKFASEIYWPLCNRYIWGSLFLYSLGWDCNQWYGQKRDENWLHMNHHLNTSCSCHMRQIAFRIRVLRQHTRHCWKHAILGQIWGVRVEPILEFFIYFCLFSGGSVGLLLSKEWRCKIVIKIEQFVRIVQLSAQGSYTKHPTVQILVKSKQRVGNV